MDELDALWAFLVAAAIAFLVTPLTARFARRLGVVHFPRDRDLHDRPVPLLGGLAIFVAAAVSALIFLPGNQETRGIVAGAAAITLVGAIDDARPNGLNPLVKLLGQFGAAAIPVWSGVRVPGVTLPFIDPLQLGDWSYPLTLVGMVAVMNVVNFTDGADGLAAGVCTIAAATFAVIALSLDRDAAGVLAALTAGAAIGFLWHNFHPASVFMGDTGSNLLGLLLACVAIQGVLKTAAVVALFFPLLILAAGTSTTASRTSASRSDGPCSTCTAGRCRWRRWRWRCASCRTRTTTARSTPAGRW
jgi:UDP-GlcNAc:undecaprenyl-phosphate GlcNAc-1-phosphate transferase